MPVLSTPWLGFALGAGLYWSSARQLAHPVRPLAGHALLIVAGFGFLVYAPAVAFLLGAEPDWCLGYWAPADRLPRWSPSLWTLFSGASVPAGFAVGRSASRGRSNSFRLALAWVPLLLAGLPLLLSGSRLTRQASYEQFHGDFAVRPVLGSSLGYLLLALICALSGAVWLTRRSLRHLALGAVDGA